MSASVRACVSIALLLSYVWVDHAALAQSGPLNGIVQPRLLELRSQVEAKVVSTSEGGKTYRKDDVVVVLDKDDVERAWYLARQPGREVVSALWRVRYYDRALDDDPFTVPYPRSRGRDIIRGADYPRVTGWLGPDKLPGSSPLLLEHPIEAGGSRIVLRDASETGDCSSMVAYWRRVEQDTDWTRRDENFAFRVGMWLKDRRVTVETKSYSNFQVSPLVPLIAEHISAACSKIEGQHKYQTKAYDILRKVPFTPRTGYAVAASEAQNASDTDVRGQLRSLGAEDAEVESLLALHKRAENYLQSVGVLSIKYSPSQNPESKNPIVDTFYTEEQSSLIPYVLKSLISQAIPIDTGDLVKELPLNDLDLFRRFDQPTRPSTDPDYRSELGSSVYFELANVEFDYATNRGLLATYIHDPTSLMQYAVGLPFLAEQRSQRIEASARDAMSAYTGLREEHTAGSRRYDSVELHAPESIHILSVEVAAGSNAPINTLLARARSLDHFSIMLERPPIGAFFEGGKVRVVIAPPGAEESEASKTRSWALGAILSDPAIDSRLRSDPTGSLRRIEVDATKVRPAVPTDGFGGMSKEGLTANLVKLGAIAERPSQYSLGAVIAPGERAEIADLAPFDK